MSLYSMNHKCSLDIDEVRIFEIENETTVIDGEVVETGDIFFSTHDHLPMPANSKVDDCLNDQDVKERFLGNVPLGAPISPPSSGMKGQLSQASVQNDEKVTLYLFRIKPGQNMKFGGAPPFQVAGNPDGNGSAEIFSNCCFLQVDGNGDGIDDVLPKEIYFSGEPTAPNSDWACFVFDGKKAKHRVEKFMMEKHSYAVMPNFVNSNGERKMVGLEVNGRGWPHPCPDHMRFFTK